jgi:hydrogenase 3 maturation protease
MIPVEPNGASSAAVEELEMRLREIRARRLVIIGVGNFMRADDFAGSLVAKKLMSRFGQVAHRLLILDTKDSPENFTKEVRAFEPDTVVFVDSAVMGCPPGTIRMISLDETRYPYFSTHNLPLRLLTPVMGDVESSFLIGIEPRTTEFGEQMSEEVKAACSHAAEAIYRVVRDSCLTS